MAQAAEKRWWRNYLSKRDPATYLAWKRAYWKEFMASTGLSPKPGSTVLDAGCGPAGICIALPDCAVTAIDPLLNTYAELPHFQLAKAENISFREGSLEDGVGASAYDWVFSLNVVNHVRDLAGVCRVLAKAAKPGGRVVVSVDAHRHAWLKPFFRAIPGDVLHPHQLSLEEYVSVLRDSGLSLRAKTLIKREAIFDYYVLDFVNPPT